MRQAKERTENTMKTTSPKTELETLAEFLDCNPSDLSEESHDHYGLTVYSLGSKEYAIGTDSQADQACEDHIRDSAWAFNASFILSECGLPSELEECLQSFQSDKCESANDAIVALIEKCNGSMTEFTQAAISADGRGHFLSPYDGCENEQGGFYIYRVN